MAGSAHRKRPPTGSATARVWDIADGLQRGVMPQPRISEVNLAELVGKLVDRGASDSAAREVLDGPGLEVAAFDPDQAFAAGLRDARDGRLRFRSTIAPAWLWPRGMRRWL